jgi:hypothetical protein
VRQQYPDLAAGYDDLNKSYDSLLRNEIAKCNGNEVLAKQRLAYSHPELMQAHLAKGDDAEVRFMNRAADIWRAEGGSRCEAMTKARREVPRRFAKFQEV